MHIICVASFKDIVVSKGLGYLIFYPLNVASCSVYFNSKTHVDIFGIGNIILNVMFLFSIKNYNQFIILST